MRTIPPIFRQSRVAAALALALSPAIPMAATITVNSTATAGPGTLHDAILQANSNCFSDNAPTIAFAFTGTGPFTISPSSPLPEFQCTSGSFFPTVDGYTQPGSSPNTLAQGWNATLKVVVNGSLGSSSSGCGLAQFNFGYGGNLTVKGLRVQNFSYGGDTGGVCGRIDVRGNEFVNNDYGVYLSDYGFSVGSSGSADRNVFTGNDVGVYSQGGGTTVENNFIGTKDGSTAAGNGSGIYIGGGGGGFISGNVISGNTGVGIDVYGDYGGVTIESNVIGLNAARTAKLANAGGGIVIRESEFSLITDNFISGNSVAGIFVQNSSFVEIEDNTIGLNYGGGAIPNTRGVDATCGTDYTIDNNIISGNQFEGLFLSGIQASDIENNTIADNKGSGLRLDLGSCYGGNNFVYGNLVTGNSIDGILLTGGTTRNLLGENLAHHNGRKNINLNSTTTPLPNDAGDGDGGSNNQQNYPVLDSVTQNGGQTDIAFTLNTQDGDYNLEFFSNDAAGGPAGENFLGSTTVTVSGGTFSNAFTAYALVSNISATATALSTPNGDTSEFSPQKAATTAPAAMLSPASLNFGNQRVGTTSADRVVLLRSIGDQPYVISSFCYGGLDAKGLSVVKAVPSLCTGGAFTCESTCVPGQSYAKGSSCRITASFTPPFATTFNDELGLCDNSATGFTPLDMTGVGVPPPPLTISPTFYDFGGIPLGNVSDTARFEVKNTSYGALSMLGVVTSGEFDLVSTTCTGVLYGGNICEAIVAFAPTQSGDAIGSVTAAAGPVGDAAVQGVAPFTIISASADLVGVGLAGGEMALPGPIELGAAPVGGAAITRTVELKNTGTQPVHVASVTVSAPFTLINNCTAPIAPGATCTLVIGYAATAPGSVNGTLTIVSDATGGSGEVSVHATGQSIAAPLVVASPTSIGFGDRTIGTQTSPRTVTLTNIGGLTANLSLSVSSIDFLLGGTSCGATLAPQASCIADVSFRPILGFGPRTGALVVSSNSPTSPLSVILGGTSCRPFIGLGSRTGTSSNCAP